MFNTVAFLQGSLVYQISLALLQRPDTHQGDWISSDDTICKYEIHLHGTVSKVRATPFNVLFRSGNVLVINGEGGLRHLAFRDKGGGCHEQTRVVCHLKHASSFLMASASKAVASKVEDRCLSQPCNA